MPIGTLTQKMNCQLEALDDRAADERPERDGEAGDRAPGAEREAAALGRDGVREDRQGQRGDDRGAEALEGPGDDEQVAGRGERRERGRAGEQGDADDEHPLAAEAVAEGGAGQQEDGEGQGVGVDRPLELRTARRRGSP